MTDRVLWLVKGLGRGGAEQLLVGLLEYIDRSEFDVEVAYLLPWKDALVGEFERRGVVVHCLENRRPLDLRWMARLRTLIDRQRYVLVHTHMPYVAAGARISAPRDVAMVHTEHNMWDRYRFPTRIANLATFGRNAAAIAVSDAVARSMRFPRWLPGGHCDVQVIRYGADLAQIERGAGARAEARRRLELAPGDLVVGSVANFTAKKDQATLLAAVALLTGSRPDLRLVLIGTGPLESSLRERVAELGLEDRVTFTGMRDDVYAILPGFDVFALSSMFEGLPISLLEAMASGVACVATRVGGIPEVVTDGVDGRLVPPGDVDALTHALGDVLDDAATRRSLGDAGAARAATFDLRTACESTQAVYERALTGS